MGAFGALKFTWEAVIAITGALVAIGTVVGWLHAQREKTQQAQRDEEQVLVAERRAKLGAMEKLAEDWQKRAGKLTGALGTLGTDDSRLQAAHRAFEKLQGIAQGQLRPAFDDRDSALMCAERHIRALKGRLSAWPTMPPRAATMGSRSRRSNASTS
jgi:hypothetical protein